jgi:hypothetical protein
MDRTTLKKYGALTGTAALFMLALFLPSCEAAGAIAPVTQGPEITRTGEGITVEMTGGGRLYKN